MVWRGMDRDGEGIRHVDKGVTCNPLVWCKLQRFDPQSPNLLSEPTACDSVGP